MEWLATAAAAAAPLALGAAAGHATRDDVRSAWYAALRKPSWQPPAWLFAPVWTALYVLMGLALWLVASSGVAPPATLALFAAQLALNLSWSFVFFRRRNPRAALAVIVALLGAVVLTAARFYAVVPAAGLALVPYAAWVGFATALNAAIVLTN